MTRFVNTVRIYPCALRVGIIEVRFLVPLAVLWRFDRSIFLSSNLPHAYFSLRLAPEKDGPAKKSP
jgi:hypothetical protein